MNLWNKKENKGKMFLNYSLHVQRLLPFRQMHILKNIKYFCLIKKNKGHSNIWNFTYFFDFWGWKNVMLSFILHQKSPKL